MHQLLLLLFFGEKVGEAGVLVGSANIFNPLEVRYILTSTNEELLQLECLQKDILIQSSSREVATNDGGSSKNC